MKLPCLLLVATLALFPSPSQAAQAITSIDTNGAAGMVNDRIGFCFATTNSVTVTSFGYRWIEFRYSYAPMVVQLLDAHSNLLATAVVSTNDTPSGPWFYHPTPAVTLPAGSTNYLLTFFEPNYLNSGAYFWSGNIATASWLNGGFQLSPPLQYLGFAVGLAPNPVDRTSCIIGPNFEFQLNTSPPPLSMSLTLANSIRLSWPASYANAVVQTSTNLTTAPLADIPTAPTISGNSRFLELPAASNQSFFRLRIP